MEDEFRSNDDFSEPKPENEEKMPSQKSKPAVETLEKFGELGSKIEKEETILADDGGPNYVLRSLSSNSLFLFLGITGSIIGIIIGGLIGASNYFPEIIGRLPTFLQSLQGKLLGGIVYGILGGIGAFMLFGIFGYVNTVLINLILSFFGGIKIRLDKQ